jgi:hypothetical protein
VKIRLGYKRPGENFPRDSDVFIGKLEDGVTKEITEAYGKGETIKDAEGTAYNLGKSLRMLSYFEWDATSPQDNRELVVEFLNRAWSHSKLRCFGDGGDEPGMASAADEEWAKTIQKVTHKAAVPTDGGRFQVVCLGPKCPMWSSNATPTNKLPTCHRELRLRARLLHPETNPEAPNYLKQLGWVEIASGSFNGMLDIQSGLQIMRSVAGRSAGIPFTLKRVPRTMFADGKRVTKATLIVDYDHDEAIRFGYSDPKLVMIRPESRKQIEAMKREQVEIARLEADFNSFQDVVPRPPALPGLPGLPAPAEHTDENPVATDENLVGDRDQVVAAAVGATEPQQLSDEQLDAKLSQQERNELKALCGGEPGNPESLAKFFELVAGAHKEFQTGQTPRDLSALTVRHAVWIKDALRQETE